MMWSDYINKEFEKEPRLKQWFDAGGTDEAWDQIFNAKNESLNEEGENNMENVENMTPEQNGISSMLSDMIVDEWETIDKYNSVIASLPKTGEYEDIKNVINDIIKEEYMHVGQLESAIKTVDGIADHIEKGEMEGDLQLDESIEEEAKFTLDESLFEE